MTAAVRSKVLDHTAGAGELALLGSAGGGVPGAAGLQGEQPGLNDEEDAAAGGIDGQHVERRVVAGGLDDVEDADDEGQASSDQYRPLFAQFGPAPPQADHQL